MFNWFKQKIDAPKEKQIHQLKQYYGDEPIVQQLVSRILGGSDCDELTNAFGPFGSIGNPIPVNGGIGELMYLKRLRCSCGAEIMFHRLGFTNIKEPTELMLDIFETVCTNGIHWDLFFLDMYHPRRSLKTPEEYENCIYNKKYSDLPLALGIIEKANHFPHDLPNIISKELGPLYGRLMKEKFKRILWNDKIFVPPPKHEDKKHQFIETIKNKSIVPFDSKVINIIESLYQFAEEHSEKLTRVLFEVANFSESQRALISVECDFFSFFIVKLAILNGGASEKICDDFFRYTVIALQNEYKGILSAESGISGELRKRLADYSRIIESEENPLDGLPKCAKALCDWYSGASINARIRGEAMADSDGGGIFTDFEMCSRAVEFVSITTVIYCIAIRNTIAKTFDSDAEFKSHIEEEIENLLSQYDN